MAEPPIIDLKAVLDLESAVSLLDALTGLEGGAKPPDKRSAPVAVDFTFRLPPGILDEIRDMARNRGCTVNAMMAGLVDLGLQARGRPGIADRHPEYVAYLQRGRRGAS